MRALLVLAALVALTGTAGAQTPDCSLVAGWQQQGPLREYGPDNLFDYMDGNAEGYLIYRFAGMKGVTCKSGGDTILIDYHEMADPEYAYGLFCSNRDARLPIEVIGMGGQVIPRRAVFAKGKYYIELAASPDKDHSAALRAFVTAIEKRIEGRSTPPEAISWFPKEKLAPNSVRLVPESVLGLRVLKRGYIGQYDFGKAFLVAEESAESAAQVMVKLKERIGQTSSARIGDDAFTGIDRYLDGLCVFRKGRFIGGFANLKGGRDATAEASALAASVR
jgi:hypothetical protein